MSLFPHEETQVMALLGIRSRNVMREMRQEVLTEGQNWILEGKRVCLTDEALQKLLLHLKNAPRVNGTVCESLLEPKTPPLGMQAAPLALLEVIRSKLVNKHVLICVRPGQDPTMPTNWLTVRVRDNTNFLPKTPTGMILARSITETLWEFAGNPKNPSAVSCHCPRFRGRW